MTNEERARLEALEKKVQALEQARRTERRTLEQIQREKETELVQIYGEFTSKTQAARALGVTRATVYTMIKDGRIKAENSGAGKVGGVDVRSMADYLITGRAAGL